MKPRPRSPRGQRRRPLSDEPTTRSYFGLSTFRAESQQGRQPTPRSIFASSAGLGVGPRAQASPQEVEGVYIISVAARILEMHPQTLRKYERVGLVRPSRTVGMLRLYSEEDIAKLRLIKHLVVDLGLNLAGVQLTLQMFGHLLNIRSRLNLVEANEHRSFLEETLNELFELLHAHLPRSARAGGPDE